MLSSSGVIGWVTPGAATEGVTPLFFPEKTGDLFLVASSAVSSLVFLLIAVTINIAFYCFHSGVTPSRMSPHTFFYLSDLDSLIFFVSLPTKKIFGCHPRGGPPPPPPSDATVVKRYV